MMTPMNRPRWQQVLIALGKAAAYLALFLGWQMLVSMVYTSYISARLIPAATMIYNHELLYQVLLEELMGKMMEISLVSGLFTLGSVAVFFRIRRRPLRRELWLRPVPGRVLGWAAALSFCLYWLVTMVLALLPAAWMEAYTEASAGLEQTGLLSFVATALVAPVVEEVIFRGLIYTRLQRAIPPLGAAILSAAIFGACHGQAVWFCYAFLLGLIFALLARATGSILPGMLMHFVFNATNEVLALLLGDWEPGLWFTLLIGLFGTVVLAFCAWQLYRAVSALPAPPMAAEPAPISPAGAGERPVPPPPSAQWDEDSGPRHKFPPHRM